ncbi:hypothetical protein LTR91_005513 [Friedmanniomyces endolithicus]|uniref:Uncharacterized protein n=1 Tax=Friedmanniomyces endolithicus TaxID=329885 RepID=A0A4U0V0T1_9PEZI|nr:hypothetical protein LTS09_012744 [Friedmanniomyces endolithicus]KAK0279761.1 hypothetical protein LTR35_008484 [Friedmanniomyces endolithicus]KAK0294765.1 hypothetical protein LTS00_006600 [Friedmanniomyces endolithicus]KAK0306381.1 hypothetical protein LTR01_006239 [Friedmanniomyces endolithicus]KAK0322464.1 hypothetical protein LTR82_006423 [Friedmanniomyces endolithicus]
MANTASSRERHHYSGADLNAAQTLLDLSRPADPADTRAARTLLAISQQQVRHTPQPLTGSEPNPTSQTSHLHNATNPNAAAALPLYIPPLPPLTQAQDHQILTTYTGTSNPLRPLQYDEEDIQAANILLALNPQVPSPETLTDSALVAMYWSQLDDATVMRLVRQYGEAGIVEMGSEGRDQAAGGRRARDLGLGDVEERVHDAQRRISGSEMEVRRAGEAIGRAGEARDAVGGQSGPGRIQPIRARHTEAGRAEDGERRDSANDGALAAGHVGARGLRGLDDGQEKSGRDERSLFFE